MSAACACCYRVSEDISISFWAALRRRPTQRNIPGHGEGIFTVIFSGPYYDLFAAMNPDYADFCVKRESSHST